MADALSHSVWPKHDLWPLMEPLVKRAQRPSRYVNHEWGALVKEDADFHFCMVYPDTYELGQPNQAVRILVNVVNATPHLAAERGYLPSIEMCDTLRAHGLPLTSIETCSPLVDFDVVGITMPHELCATNILEVLDLGGIPIFAADRTEEHPIVMGGGPCAFNPEPFSGFFDIINVGEGEESMPELLCLIRQLKREGKSRQEIVLACAAVPGTYIPSAYEPLSAEEASMRGVCVAPKPEYAHLVPRLVMKRVFDGFATSPAWEPCIVPYTEIVHDRLNVEILRGCTRGCRFCQAGMMYRPVRERSADNIVESVREGLRCTGYDEVSLTSLSTTDHSQIAEILTRLDAATANTGVRVSIPSQRLDSFGVEMARLIAGQKKGGLTFAPEAGTQRLRDVINKNVTEEDLFGAVRAAFAAGWRRCKLYFMIGLPTETDEDILGMADLAERVLACARETLSAAGERGKGGAQISLSIAVFVPKAQTPFQWDGQIAPDEARRRVGLLRRSLRSRAIDVHYHDPVTSSVEALMSRGGREVCRLVAEAWKRGARFDAWTELFRRDAWEEAAAVCGISPAAIAQANLPFEAPLPWNHISTGVTTLYLRHERKRAERGVTTPDCSFGPCTGCGACRTLDSAVVTQGVRVAGGNRSDAGAASGQVMCHDESLEAAGEVDQ